MSLDVVKARPILFSAPMVRALQEGRKTQTRRIVKGLQFVEKTAVGIKPYWRLLDKPSERDGGGTPMGPHVACLCPYGQPGDLLRVKESAWMWCERRPNGMTKKGRQKWHYVPLREAPINYAADHPRKPSINVVSPETGNSWGWRLKVARFLPRWASRLSLRITDVRVERLQEISEDDALAEGVTRDYPIAQVAYRDLWESLHGPGSWAANPWVWVLSFSVIHANVDAVLRKAA